MLKFKLLFFISWLGVTPEAADGSHKLGLCTETRSQQVLQEQGRAAKEGSAQRGAEVWSQARVAWGKIENVEADLGMDAYEMAFFFFSFIWVAWDCK